MSQRNEKRTRGRAHRFPRALALPLALVGTIAAGGCEDYLERRDTVTLGVGDSVAFNKATQTINRWPAAAREDRWLSDGERARIAQTRYRNRAVPSPRTLEKSGDMEPAASGQGGATSGK